MRCIVTPNNDDTLKWDARCVSRHIRNVFNEGELEEQSTCAKFAHMGHDGLQQYETVM